MVSENGFKISVLHSIDSLVKRDVSGDYMLRVVTNTMPLLLISQRT